jgi:Ca-activated chloride channel family protein
MAKAQEKLMTLSKLFVLIVLTAIPVVAQEVDEVFKLNVNVDLVELHVSVFDEKDRTVSGLKQEHFRVIENRVEQPIALFKQEDIPVSLGLVIDNSRSIQPRKERLDAGAVAFVRRGNVEDETFIVHFDNEARVSQGFTGSIEALEQTLAATKPFGQTAIYDALSLALKYMERANHQKKAILLITDGLDNVSLTTLEETIEGVRRSKVAVYTMGLLSSTGGVEAERSLIDIAEASGGRAYFPESVEEARIMMERIASDLRQQYTLGYFPTNPNRDGAWRSVRVEVIPPLGFPPKLTTDYRHGYYGPADR